MFCFFFLWNICVVDVVLRAMESQYFPFYLTFWHFTLTLYHLLYLTIKAIQWNLHVSPRENKRYKNKHSWNYHNGKRYIAIDSVDYNHHWYIVDEYVAPELCKPTTKHVHIDINSHTDSFRPETPLLDADWSLWGLTCTEPKLLKQLQLDSPRIYNQKQTI